MSDNQNFNNNVLIEVKDLHKAFGDHEVLKGINTTISKGEVVAIIGASYIRFGSL